MKRQSRCHFIWHLVVWPPEHMISFAINKFKHGKVISVFEFRIYKSIKFYLSSRFWKVHALKIITTWIKKVNWVVSYAIIMVYFCMKCISHVKKCLILLTLHIVCVKTHSMTSSRQTYRDQSVVYIKR